MATAPLILIAEDEADTARLIDYHLQRNGFKTVLAADGMLALNGILEWKPDLVILDLMLPQMHGFEICRMVKTSPLSRHIPVLMLTAMATNESKLEGFRCGADDYMTKPFEMTELLARIHALLRRSLLPAQ